MKTLSLLFMVATALFSTKTYADWPKDLTGFSSSEQKRMNDKIYTHPGTQLNLSDFKFDFYNPTVEGYGIVHYRAHSKPYLCEASDKYTVTDKFYVSLYVNPDQSIEYITNFGGAGCRED